jgi:hypothetical protein
MFLLLGHSTDPCCQAVCAALEGHGLDARIIDSPFAPPARLAWHLDADGLRTDLYPHLPGSAIDGVLVRDTGWLDPVEWEADDFAYMQAELRAVMLAWLHGLECPVINRPDASQWYRAGMPLMAWRRQLRAAGLKLPEMVITSEPEESAAFRRRLEADGAGGAVYAPLTNSSSYLLADDDAWQRLASLQAHVPVCLTQAHGPAALACVVGDDVIWNDAPPPGAPALETALRRFAAGADLTFVEIAMAPVRGEPVVVLVEPRPRLERYHATARMRIVAALVAALTRGVATGARRLAS